MRQIAAFLVGVLPALGCDGNTYDVGGEYSGAERFEISAEAFDTWPRPPLAVSANWPEHADVAWPFTVDRGDLWCDGSGAIWLTTDGPNGERHWPLNDNARIVAPVLGHPYQADGSEIMPEAHSGVVLPITAGLFAPEYWGVRWITATGERLCGR